MDAWRAEMRNAIMHVGLARDDVGVERLWAALRDRSGAAALALLNELCTNESPHADDGERVGSGGYGDVVELTEHGRLLVCKEQMVPYNETERQFALAMLTEAVIQLSLQVHEETSRFVPHIVRVAVTRAPHARTASPAFMESEGRRRAPDSDTSPPGLTDSDESARARVRANAGRSAPTVSVLDLVFHTTMERCEESLQQWLLDDQARAPVVATMGTRAARWDALAVPLRDVALALRTMQRVFGFAHRDLKENNIMCFGAEAARRAGAGAGGSGAGARVSAPPPRWVLIDFGLACMSVTPVAGGAPLQLRGASGKYKGDLPCLDPARDMMMLLNQLLNNPSARLHPVAVANLKALLGDAVQEALNESAKAIAALAKHPESKTDRWEAGYNYGGKTLAQLRTRTKLQLPTEPDAVLKTLSSLESPAGAAWGRQAAEAETRRAAAVPSPILGKRSRDGLNSDRSLDFGLGAGLPNASPGPVDEPVRAAPGVMQWPDYNLRSFGGGRCGGTRRSRAATRRARTRARTRAVGGGRW
jgi:hypothetical protein